MSTVQDMTTVEAAQSLGALAADVLLRQVRGVDQPRRRTREDPHSPTRCLTRSLAVQVDQYSSVVPVALEGAQAGGGSFNAFDRIGVSRRDLQEPRTLGNRHSAIASTGTKSTGEAISLPGSSLSCLQKRFGRRSVRFVDRAQ